MKRLALLAILAASPAWAEDAPLLRPTRDVDVTYRAALGDRAFDQRWRYGAEQQLLRLDLPAQGTYLIADERAHAAEMVSDGQRAVLEIPLPAAGPVGLQPGQSYARLGADSVAGLPCTEWRTRDSTGRDTVACVTADGVMLRARHGDRVVVEATSVRYGAIDPAAFGIPPGYRHESARR